MVAHIDFKGILFNLGVVTLDFKVVKLFQNLVTLYNSHNALLPLSLEFIYIYIYNNKYISHKTDGLLNGWVIQNYNI